MCQQECDNGSLPISLYMRVSADLLSFVKRHVTQWISQRKHGMPSEGNVVVKISQDVGILPHGEGIETEGGILVNEHCNTKTL